VRIKTRTGVIERKLAYRDGAGGAKHFRFDAGGVKSELSFNPQTREYFFAESGAASGKPYSVKAHGWLKAGARKVAAT
jgi:hypothetical protein